MKLIISLTGLIVAPFLILGALSVLFGAERPQELEARDAHNIGQFFTFAALDVGSDVIEVLPYFGDDEESEGEPVQIQIPSQNQYEVAPDAPEQNPTLPTSFQERQEIPIMRSGQGVSQNQITPQTCPDSYKADLNCDGVITFEELEEMQ
ncbi:MAG: hypothetical protein ACFE0I_02460 [Elainellaceae cyanobacterium]